MTKAFRLLKPYKKQIILGPLFKFAEALFELLLPLFMARLIDAGLQNNDRNYILKMGGFMLLIALVGTASSFTCQYFASVAGQGYGTDLRQTLFAHVGRFSFAQMDKWGAAALTNRITGDVRMAELGLAMAIRLLMRLPVIVICSMGMILWIYPRLFPLLLLCVGGVSLLLFVIMRKALPFYKKALTALDKISLTIGEYLSGTRVIRAFVRSGSEKKRFEEANQEYKEHYRRFHLTSALSNPLTSLVLNGAILLVLYWGGLRVTEGKLTQGELIACVSYFTQMIMALMVFSILLPILSRAQAGYGRISALLETEPEELPVTADKETIRGKEDEALSFENVSFAYGDSQEKVLEDISFTVKKGQTLGVAGGTGSGKSTLLFLIGRFYEGSQGKICLFGRNITAYTEEERQELFSMVPQKAQLMAGTIEDNIRMGQDAGTREDVLQALAMAQADFVTDISAKVLRGGENFSGGQKQRMTIARALFRKPKLLLLDDAASALDYRTEKRLMESIKTMDTTVITASPRIKALKSCDSILVLDKGRAVGFGTHEALMESCKVYREIAESQA